MSFVTSLARFSARSRLATPRFLRRPMLLATCLVFTLSTPVWAVSIDFDNGTVIITDNGVGDLNAAAGIIDFNQTISSYKMIGTVDTKIGPNLVSLLGSPTAALRMTNFTAEAIGSPSASMPIQFFDTVGGFFPAVTGADSLDAYVGHATGAAVPFANDSIINWQGFISGVVITGVLPGPPPYFNPFLPASSAPLPYSVVTHGPTFMGAFLNPVFGAYLEFQLGSNGDQLILFNSADLGMSAVPEPSTIGLLATGLVGLIVARRRFSAVRVKG